MNSTEQNPGDVHGFFSRDNTPVCEASVQIPGKSVMSFLTGSPEPGRSLDANSFQPCDTAERALKTCCLAASLLFSVAKCVIAVPHLSWGGKRGIPFCLNCDFIKQCEQNGAE